MTAFRLRTLFALGCAAVIAVEGYILFFDRDHTFSIQGRRTYLLSEFADGIPIAHAFLMRGNGLRAVRVQFSSSTSTTVRLQWQLFRQQATDKKQTILEWGHRELRLDADRNWATFPVTRRATSEKLSIMEGGTRELRLEAGRTWATFPVTRDGSSHDRWYVFEAQLVDPPSPDVRDRAQIALLATHDNPDRGGSLFVAGRNQPGSLVLGADRVGHTLHQRFVAEVEPNLPRWLRWPAVQWIIGLALHAAVAVHAHALLIDRQLRGREDGTCRSAD